ncbi:MAG: type II CAAX endopeptidase family protein [Chloroflexota bacterium]
MSSSDLPPGLDPEDAAGGRAGDQDQPGPGPAPPRIRPGASIFTIEGRSAPALFVVGWLATLLGFGLVAVGILSGGGAASLALFIVGLALLSLGLIAGAGSQGIERRVGGVLAYRGPSPLLVFAASIPLSLLIGIATALPLGALGVPLDGPVGALLSVSIQALVYVALVRLLVVDPAALDWAAMGIRRLDRTALLEMGGGALWAVPVIVVTAVVSSILLRIFPVQPVSPLPPTGEPVGFALSLLAGVIVAPLGEELLFRGFATTAWVRGLGSRRGLVLAALVFAFAHVLTVTGTNLGEAFGLAVVGFASRVPIALALGWIFLRRGTIWASFGLHAAFNAILLILAEALSRSI